MECEVIDVVVCMSTEMRGQCRYPPPLSKGTRKLCVSIKKCCTEANSAGQYIERGQISALETYAHALFKDGDQT